MMVSTRKLTLPWSSQLKSHDSMGVFGGEASYSEVGLLSFFVKPEPYPTFAYKMCLCVSRKLMNIVIWVHA